MIHDTSPEIRKKYREMLMSRSPVERLEMATSMFDSARELVAAGLRSDSPELTDAQIRARVFLRFYGKDFGEAGCRKILENIPNTDTSGIIWDGPI